MAQRRIPRAIQYGTIQQMLFVMGIMLGMGVMTETGVLGDISAWIDYNIHNIWIVGIISGFLSSLVDTFTMAITNISLYPIVENDALGVWMDDEYLGNFVRNGMYWKVVAFSTAVGGCLLCVGSTSGLALMKMEHVRLGWYLKTLAPKVLLGFILGLIILWAESFII
jgi:Na+/H+ antiporter NhaD/arsenite permease-like protein